MTSKLSEYIQKALPVVLDRPDRANAAPAIFEPGFSFPRLSHSEDSWILHYGGAFNPPHVGHLAVLSHALTSHGTGLTIVAAMIDPKDDSYLMGKNAESDETFVITKTDRATLWRYAEGFPSGSTWIFEGSECYKPVFMHELQVQAQRAGFVVKFLQIRGPDIVRPDSPPSRGTSNCDALLIVAGSRETENFSAGRRARLRGYGPWRRVEMGGSAGEDAEMSTIWYSRVFDEVQRFLRHLMGHPPLRCQHGGKDSETWYCDSESETGWKAYMVADTSDSTGAPISSTKIRHALKREVVRGVVNGIAAMALSPRLLVAMVRLGTVLLRQSSKEQSD